MCGLELQENGLNPSGNAHLVLLLCASIRDQLEPRETGRTTVGTEPQPSRGAKNQA